ncbi:hypothetical protein B0H16DRAFT_585196 [Mycena metata]|uniref:Uncharacterized protein n=1 Tax=Mycena metata TaxID=1033252 RepID=A0AAD7NGI6_9AGAR|nr:hypothetical protein B0H16DRAFT_585196 [Mycena metata]
MKLDVPAPCTTYRLTNPPEPKNSSVLATLIGATQMPQYFPEMLRIRSMEDDLKFRYNVNGSDTEYILDMGHCRDAWTKKSLNVGAQGGADEITMQYTHGGTTFQWRPNKSGKEFGLDNISDSILYEVVEGQPNLDAPLARLNVSLQYKARPKMTLTGGWSATLPLFWDLFQVETGGWPVEFREPCDRAIVAAMVTAMQLAS